MTANDISDIKCIGGKVDGDLTTLTLPAGVVDILDVLAGRWRRDRKTLSKVIGETWNGGDTVELLGALVDRWIELGVSPCFEREGES